MKKLLIAVTCVTGALAFASAALAAAFTLHGTAQAEIGHVKLVSDFSVTTPATPQDDAGWIDFKVPPGLTFAGLTSLQTEFNVTDDDCGGGSPRFQVEVGGKNVFVYLGPSPSFTGCAPNTWHASGNLVGTSDACRVDTSQLSPGTQCTTWAAAVALLGPQAVTGIQLVVDGGWQPADREETVLVRNVTINHKTYITPQAPPRPNPAKLCAAQRASLGTSAFNELWGTNGNDRNAFGKCVSAMAKAQGQGTAATAQASITKAAKTCKAKGLRGQHLGACVSSHDGLKATSADPPGRRR